MARITNVRSLLLSGPFGSPDSRETRLCFGDPPFKTTGLVEVTLDDGTIGIGEGYLAAFAPRVFESLVRCLGPEIVGKDASDIRARVRDLEGASSYWSRQGAARHVIGAFEIALVDARAKQLGVPAYQLFGGARQGRLPLYASGGDSITPDAMTREIDRVADLGIRIFKVRALSHEVNRTAFALRLAGERGIRVGVDSYQNLADPAQSPADVETFVRRVHDATNERILFLEECLGVNDKAGYALLRSKLSVLICGGETVTLPVEMAQLIDAGAFDFVQPDATVIGGIGAVLEVFAFARARGCGVVIHAWGGAACLMANYHAALSGGGLWAEYPMLPYSLRDEMLVEPFQIVDGALLPPTVPGIGVRLTQDIIDRYPFREDAVYRYRPEPFEDWNG